MNQPLRLPGVLNGIGKTLVSLGLALLPKCGLCLAAWLNLFGVFGLSVTRYYSWFQPLLLFLLALSLIFGFLKARKLNRYRAFSCSLAGASLLLTGKLWIKAPLLTWTGLALFVLAGVIQWTEARKSCPGSFPGSCATGKNGIL